MANNSDQKKKKGQTSLTLTFKTIPYSHAIQIDRVENHKLQRT